MKHFVACILLVAASLATQAQYHTSLFLKPKQPVPVAQVSADSLSSPYASFTASDSVMHGVMVQYASSTTSLAITLHNGLALVFNDTLPIQGPHPQVLRFVPSGTGSRIDLVETSFADSVTVRVIPLGAGSLPQDTLSVTRLYR